MTITSPAAVAAADPTQLPDSFLICYEITNPKSLAWPVRLYEVIRVDGSGQSHGDRGEIKQAIWELRKKYSSLCRGYGFVVDVAMPSLRVQNKAGGERILPAPSPATEITLQERGRTRQEHVRQNGFLQYRPINPLLAWPKPLGWDRARRMMSDLNYILKLEGIDYRFEAFLYQDVEHLGAHIAKKGFDALLAVLPEGWQEAHRGDNTHEQIKRRIEVPSQCIQHDHTLPESWVNRSHSEFMQAHSKLARRIRQRYELCVWNLLVKHHWVPFAPSDPFHYNVHVGLDVGGQHNNRAMACLGYGFADPSEGLYFLPEEIPIDVGKAEPIPTHCLYQGCWTFSRRPTPSCATVAG